MKRSKPKSSDEAAKPTKKQKSESSDGKHEIVPVFTDQEEKMLSDILQKLEDIEEKVTSEVHEIESKYNNMRQPILLKRDQLVAKVPDFWEVAFLSNQNMEPHLSPTDVELLKHTRRFAVRECDNALDGFDVNFEFESNDIITNKTLTKKYRFLLPTNGSEDSKSGETSRSSRRTRNVTSDRIQWHKNVKETEESLFGVLFGKDDDADPEHCDALVKTLRDIYTDALDLYIGAPEDNMEITDEDQADA